MMMSPESIRRARAVGRAAAVVIVAALIMYDPGVQL